MKRLLEEIVFKDGACISVILDIFIQCRSAAMTTHQFCAAHYAGDRDALRRLQN